MSFWKTIVRRTKQTPLAANLLTRPTDMRFEPGDRIRATVSAGIVIVGDLLLVEEAMSDEEVQDVIRDGSPTPDDICDLMVKCPDGQSVAWCSYDSLYIGDATRLLWLECPECHGPFVASSHYLCPSCR